MPKTVITQEQREAEAKRLRALLEAAQAKDESLTQESLAGEMNVSQGLINQWLSGKKTPIPVNRLLWLSRRLGFNPLDVRPTLQISLDALATERDKKTMHVYLTNPEFHKIVNAIAESAGYYDKAPQPSRESPLPTHDPKKSKTT